MIRLVDCVDVIANNKQCVLLKVKEGMEMNLLATGHFDGDETMIRMTKDRDCNCYTILRTNDKKVNWNDRTLISQSLKNIQNEIRNCIERDLKINMRG